MNKILKLSSLVILGAVIAYFGSLWINSRGCDFAQFSSTKFKQAQLDIKSISLDGTNEIWHIKSDSNLTCFKLVFKNEGHRSFPKDSAGLTILCNSIWEGAGNRDDIALKKILEDFSIELDIYHDDDDFIVKCSCLDRYFELAMSLITDVLTQAHLKSDKIEFEKQGVVTTIQQNMFTPSYLAKEKLNHLMYEESHPYRYSIEEDLKRAKTVTKANIDTIYKSLFNPKDLEITIVSSLDQEKLKANFSKLIFTLQKTKTAKEFKKVNQRTTFAKRGCHEHVELDNPQSCVLFALPGVLWRSPEIHAAMIATAVFGSTGMVSRLATVARDKAGLVYGIFAGMLNFDMQSYIDGRAATRPENVREMIETVKEECKKLRDGGITRDELELFKVRIFADGTYDGNRSILEFVAGLRNQGIPIDGINTYFDNFKRLTVKDVNAVIKKLFDPESIIFVDCGKSISKGPKIATKPLKGDVNK